MRFSLFDDDDLRRLGAVLTDVVERAFDMKALEDTIAKGMARGIVTALKIAQRDGMLLRADLPQVQQPVRPITEPFPDLSEPVEREPEPVRRVATPLPVVEPEPAPVTEPEAETAPEVPAPVAEPSREAIPRFLRPAPELPFPPGKAVEPPPLKREAKTRKIYLELYKTVPTRPPGYLSIVEACTFLGGQQFSGPVSTWLQTGQLDAVIVADEKPTKGLPGKLMIKKESLVARDQLRRANRHLAVHDRVRRAANASI